MPAPAELDVLIVDDHEPMRALLRTVLARAGVSRARDASTAPVALALIADAAPNLILADRRMPDMDGLAFIAAVRATLAADACRIIMISGDTDANARVAALAAGADMVLTKPVTPRELLAAIEALYA